MERKMRQDRRARFELEGRRRMSPGSEPGNNTTFPDYASGSCRNSRSGG
jgi:hypothetical protein